MSSSNYMIKRKLNAGTTMSVTLPKGKNWRMILYAWVGTTPASNLALHYTEQPSTLSIAAGFTLNFRLTPTAPFILEPPAFFQGDLLYISERSGAESPDVYIWMMGEE